MIETVPCYNVLIPSIDCDIEFVERVSTFMYTIIYMLNTTFIEIIYDPAIRPISHLSVIFVKEPHITDHCTSRRSPPIILYLAAGTESCLHVYSDYFSQYLALTGVKQYWSGSCVDCHSDYAISSRDSCLVFQVVGGWTYDWHS